VPWYISFVFRLPVELTPQANLPSTALNGAAFCVGAAYYAARHAAIKGFDSTRFRQLAIGFSKHDYS
jgi:hypothetical protein